MNIHVLGIAGRGMLRLAELATLMGHHVTGSDKKADTVISSILDKSSLYKEPNIDLVKAANLVVYSAGFPEDHQELIAARQLCIPTFSRLAGLSKILRLNGNKPLTVCGSFGKTTTTTLLSLIMDEYSDPVIYIGGHAENYRGGVKYGTGEYAVVEACEYKGEYFNLDSYGIVLTNIEENHLDYYSTTENLVNSFRNFIIHNQPLANDRIFVCSDSPLIAQQLVPNLAGKISTFGLNSGDWRADNCNLNNSGGVSFDVKHKGKFISRFDLSIPGEQVALDSLGVIALAYSLGASSKQITAGLSKYKGIKRRFEIKYKDQFLTVIDDMARMPLQVQATIKAARFAYPDSKLYVVCGFWGKLNKRDLLSFSVALKHADYSYILPVGENGDQFGGAEYQDADKRLKLLIESESDSQGILATETSLGDIISRDYSRGQKTVIVTIGYDSFLGQLRDIIQNTLNKCGINDVISFDNYM